MALMTTEQVAEFLGVKEERVRRLERESLLIAAEKDDAGNAKFNEDDVKRYKELAERIGADIADPNVRITEVLANNIGKNREAFLSVAQEFGLSPRQLSAAYASEVSTAAKVLAGQSAISKKAKRTQIKEMKFRPGTDEGDYQVKLRNLTRFLEDGDKAKVTLRFRGRELLHQDLGMDLLNRVREDLAELGVVEFEPKMEGRQMTMVIAPRSRKKN